MSSSANRVSFRARQRISYQRSKILLFSGQAGVTNILEESKAKGFEFPLLAKPIHPSKLIERLQNLKSS
jgi:hypothetical protein